MKNYRKWVKLKIALNNKKSENNVYFREKQIWWCSLGENIGCEQDGKNKNFERPILILKKFNKNVLLMLPVTSSDKRGMYYYQFSYNNKKYSIILSQIKLISSKRLLRKIRRIDDGDFDEIKKKLAKFLKI